MTVRSTRYTRRMFGDLFDMWHKNKTIDSTKSFFHRHFAIHLLNEGCFVS